jgi:hypothetical protein
MIEINKKDLVKGLRYTDLVYNRINKKLKINLTRLQIEKMIDELILSTPIKDCKKIGKNIYVDNHSLNISITINSNSSTVITANIISKQRKVK